MSEKNVKSRLVQLNKNINLFRKKIVRKTRQPDGGSLKLTDTSTWNH